MTFAAIYLLRLSTSKPVSVSRHLPFGFGAVAWGAVFAFSPDQIDELTTFFWVVVTSCGCLGLCLIGGLVYLIYRFAYKASKQTPPASDNNENPKD